MKRNRPEPRPPYLDFDAAAERLQDWGIKASPRQVRRYADEGRLRFSKGLDGRRYIPESVLEHEIKSIFQQ